MSSVRAAVFMTPPRIEMRPVASSWIKSLGYDRASQTIAMLTERGGLYYIDAVSEEIFEEWCDADSPSEYYNAYIKGNQAYRLTKAVQL